MEEDFALIDDLNTQWETYPKNTILRSDFPNGETRIWFAWEFGALRMILTAAVGRRKGLREEILLIDNSKTIYHDRLRRADITTEGDGTMLPLIEMRNKVRSLGQNPCEVAEQYMKLALEDLLVRPEWYCKYEFALERSTESVRTLQGGAPGLGKRH